MGHKAADQRVVDTSATAVTRRAACPGIRSVRKGLEALGDVGGALLLQPPLSRCPEVGDPILEDSPVTLDDPTDFVTVSTVGPKISHDLDHLRAVGGFHGGRSLWC
jgi:hypothetical protein